MKPLLIILFWLCSTFSICIAQGISLSHRADWKASLRDIEQFEYPKTPSERNLDELKYEHVPLSNGFKATIYYQFSQGLLEEVKFIIYGPESYRGTCSNIISLSQKVKLSLFVFEEIFRNGFACSGLWYYHATLCPNPFRKEESGNFCLDTSQELTRMSEEGEKCKINRFQLVFESMDSESSFEFNEFQNRITNEMDVFPMECDDDYNNIYYWLTFTQK